MENQGIYEALVKAQADFALVERDSKNPHRGYRYASLTAILAAVREALNHHGIVLLQPMSTMQGAVSIETVLQHQDGSRIVNTVVFPVLDLTTKDGRVIPAGPQEIGSAATYARRYALLSLLGLAPEEEDDDGERAQGPGRGRSEAQRRAESPTRQAASQEPVDWLAQKVKGIEAVEKAGEVNGMTADYAVAGLEKLEERQAPLEEQARWLKARLRAIQESRYVTPAPEPAPPAEPAKKRGKAKAAEEARAHLAAQEPPPWPERRLKAEAAIAEQCSRLRIAPEAALTDIGRVDDAVGPAVQAEWLKLVTARYGELKAQADNNEKYYGSASGPRPGQHMGD